MKVWSIANQKGGVGKTTTTVALGGLMAAWGFRTLMIDIDPHASLTAYFRHDPDLLERSSYDIFIAAAERRAPDMHAMILPTTTPGLDVLPATAALASLDRQSGRLEGMGLALKRAVAAVVDEYDYILIDCPPVLGILLINALAASQWLVVPVQTEFLAIKGLERMLRTISMVTRARAEPLHYIVVPTFFDIRTRASVESLSLLRREYAEHLWAGYIPIDTRLRDASRVGIPPALFDPGCRAVSAYTELLETIRRRASVIQAQASDE